MNKEVTFIEDRRGPLPHRGTLTFRGGTSFHLAFEECFDQ